MKAAWLTAMLLLGCGPLRAADETAVLRFATPGLDQLSGTLEALDGERLVWNSPVLDRPSPFFTKEVLELTLPTVFPDHDASHLATLTLEPWPEDKVAPRIRGQLVAVTDDKIILDTWYAGRLEINRLNVKAVDIEDAVKYIFSGPVGLDGWLQGRKNAWTYDNGWLRAKSEGPIGRVLDLPDVCAVAFDLSWREQLACRFCLFVEDPKDVPSRGYQLDLQSGYVSLRKINSRTGDSRMAGVAELRNQERARIEVRANRKTGDICLFVDGRYVLHWRDAEAGKARMGQGFQFSPMRNNQTLGVSKIRVTTWDGDIGTPPETDEMNPWFGGMRRVPAPSADEPPVPPPGDSATGRMLLRNGDSIAGEVLAIADGNIMVKTPFAEVKLPVSRVRNISLKPASLEQPIRRKGDVRAWFSDGTSISFRLESVSQDSVIGSSQVFGRAEFKLAAFNRIEFNIHDPRIRDLREKLGD
ncbi:MAG: hypothetical protein MUF04_03085 [Akkermansiaceae bacterium]|jgi:hypothetical protein|nr:hypothetical protein [Akkermansiaceae bacterium]